MYISTLSLTLALDVGVGRVVQWVCRLTMGWTVRGRIPVGTRFSARSDKPWGPPSLLYNGYWVFLGGKVRPGHSADHTPFWCRGHGRLPLPTLRATPGL